MPGAFTASSVASAGGGGAHRRRGDALMFVPPDDHVQEFGQAGFADAVLGALRVRRAVLMQDQEVHPLILLEPWSIHGTAPASIPH